MQRRDAIKKSFGYLGYLAALRFLIACGDEAQFSDSSTQVESSDGQANPTVDSSYPQPDTLKHPQEKIESGSEQKEPSEDGHGAEYVVMHDMYAMALYYDGETGPKTGEIKAEYIQDGHDVKLDFWHGHGGNQHQFILQPKHYQSLLRGKKTIVETTAVDGHKHTLFIDPNNIQYRIPGRPPIRIKVT